MIVATPNGKFYSEGSIEPYKWRFSEIMEEYARHLCQESRDYVVYRPLKWGEKLKVKK